MPMQPRGDGEVSGCSWVQIDPFHVQVSPRSCVPSSPPNSTTLPEDGSLAIPMYARAEGPPLLGSLSGVIGAPLATGSPTGAVPIRRAITNAIGQGAARPATDRTELLLGLGAFCQTFPSRTHAPPRSGLAVSCFRP